MLQALLEGVRKLRHQGAASSTHSNTDNDLSENNSNEV